MSNFPFSQAIHLQTMTISLKIWLAVLVLVINRFLGLACDFRTACASHTIREIPALHGGGLDGRRRCADFADLAVPWLYKHQDQRVCIRAVQPQFFAPRRGGPKYVKGSAVIFLLWSAVQVYRFHCTIISIKSLKVLVGAARFELTTPSPPAMTSMRNLLETHGL